MSNTKLKRQEYPKFILFITICSLLALLFIWLDDLYLKTASYLTYQYEVIKVLIHCTIAYKVAKFLIRRLKLNSKFSEANPKLIFTILFLGLNSYIVFQYSSRAIFNRVIHGELREVIAKKTMQLNNSGRGFECDSLSYEQFKEIKRYTNLPDIPAESENIYVYDWSELDYRRIIKFSLRKDYPIEDFYQKHPDFEEDVIVNEVEYEKYTSRLIKNKNPEYDHYKWEVGES